MDTNEARKTLKQIAEREGVSLETVHHEIELVIAEALKNTDVRMRTLWKAIPCKGEYPTPEELIIYITNNIDRNNYAPYAVIT